MMSAEMQKQTSSESSFDAAIRDPPMREPAPKIPLDLTICQMSARSTFASARSDQKQPIGDVTLLKENQQLKDEIEKLRRALATKNN